MGAARSVLVRVVAQRVALARELDGEDLRGRHVVELGCGLAVPSIAAARAGAAVLATDISDEALRLAARNAQSNGVRIDTARVDWAEPDKLVGRAPFDLVLAADVLYERASVAPLLSLIPHLAPEAWLADPGRPRPVRSSSRRAAGGRSRPASGASSRSTGCGGMTPLLSRPGRRASRYPGSGSTGASHRRDAGASRMRMMRAGAPATTAFAGTSWVTTALAPMIELSPTRTPTRTHAL